MTISRFATSIMGILGFLIPPNYALSEVTANAAFTSNYVFHGVTQTDSNPAAQGGIDYSHDRGFYAGSWSSTVDMANETGVEVDFYGGFSRELGPMRYDVGGVAYQYSNNAHTDTEEFYLKGAYARVNGALVLGDGYDYIELTYGQRLMGWDLNLRLGNTMPDVGNDVVDYGVSMGREYTGYDINAGLATTDINNADVEFFISIARGFNVASNP